MKFRRFHVVSVVFVTVWCFAIYFLTHSDVLYRPVVKNEEIIDIFHAGATKSAFTSTAVASPIPVLLVTYMRSGSTFVGNILQHNKNVFYLFEPLRLIQFGMRENTTFRYFDGSSRFYISFLDASIDILEALFTCKFRSVPTLLFTDGYLNLSIKTKNIPSCFKMSKDKTGDQNLKYQCALDMETTCMNSNYIAIKTIRIPLDILETLLEKHPKMRILHLLRDPRATLLSQMKFGVVNLDSITRDATRFCNRVYKDVVAQESMQKYFSNSLLKIRYEDIAKYPNKNAQAIYEYLEMIFSEETRQYILSITAASKSCNAALCTKSANSSKAAESWRSKANINFVKSVDQVCLPLYSKVGIRTFSTIAELRNLDLKTYTSTEQFGMGDYRYA